MVPTNNQKPTDQESDGEKKDSKSDFTFVEAFIPGNWTFFSWLLVLYTCLELFLTHFIVDPATSSFFTPVFIIVGITSDIIISHCYSVKLIASGSLLSTNTILMIHMILLVPFILMVPISTYLQYRSDSSLKSVLGSLFIFLPLFICTLVISVDRMAEHCKSLDSDLEAITNALEDEVRSRGWTSMTDYSLTDTVEITEDGYRVTLTKNLEPDAEGPPNEVQVSDTLPRDADPSKVAREIREMCDALERKAK